MGITYDVNIISRVVVKTYVFCFGELVTGI